MKVSKLSRLVINHNDKTKILTITCTKNMVPQVAELFNRICPIEFAGRETSIENTWNDEGDLFENCAVIKFTVQSDVVDIFFDAAKTSLRKSISKSINHIEN